MQQPEAATLAEERKILKVFVMSITKHKHFSVFLNFEITIYIQQTSPIFSNSGTDVSFWRTSRMGTVYKEGELKITLRSFTQAC